MLEFGLIEDIVKEPLGGAHKDPEKMTKTLKAHIIKQLKEITVLDTETLLKKRIERYKNIGEFDEITK